MKNIIRILLVLISVFSGVSCSTDFYLHRTLIWRESDVDDWKRFPDRKIARGEDTFRFKKGTGGIGEALSKCQYVHDGKKKEIGNLDSFNEDNDSTAFIIIKDDVILYENYFNGAQRDSVCTSFSVAKSCVSLLIGIAADEGLVKSSDPCVKYIPELKGRGLDSVTLADLMKMNSLVSYREGPASFGDDAYTYYYPDLRKLVFDKVKEDPARGDTFWYNNYHPLVLGIVLERATGMSVSAYMQQKLWSRIGAEYDASWSLDSERSGFEKMESGINARAVDYAKIGRLVLNKGTFQGKRIVSGKWMDESISPDLSQPKDYYAQAWFKGSDVFYKYFWYSYRRGGGYDIFA
ncbi:MAG: serine hydrolase domain-containing protein, partial [Spirochaetota bacterium]